ncbi:MAG TPA: hypothetical protein VIO64_09055 [Pseudobacteroides sp.]|uniref:hypothetical protein n=1 Tax=Pseudobacteroides sp. TaxID=1968840 RepID=UPI002F952B19
MHRKLKRIITALSVLLVISLGIAVKFYFDFRAADKRASQITSSYAEKNKELSSKIDSVNKEIYELNEKYYDEKLSKLLGVEQIISMQKSQWKYVLKANETPFTEDHVYVRSKDLVLTLTESQKEDKLLPISMHKKGSLVSGDNKDNFYEHMIIKTDIPFEKKIQTYNNYTNVFYSFENLSVGTVITLVLSEPLKERLNLHFDKLEIIVDKVDENS